MWERHGLSMRIVAGIDGGGTGTTLELLDNSGKFIERRKFGPFNVNSIGEERFRELLREIFDFINTVGECEAICIGAAGISNPAVKSIISEVSREKKFTGKLLLKGDHEIALYGAMSGKSGSILIAGTGSICTGITEDDKTARAGGWGHLIDDVGSGYALGRDALTAIVRAQDGRGVKTVLTELVGKEWKAENISQLIAETYSTADKSHIASLSPLVEQAGRQGDVAALAIIEKNAEELTELAAAVYRQLGKKELEISLLGGLLSHETLLREKFIRALSIKLPEMKVKEPDMDASAGAALWAFRMNME